MCALQGKTTAGFSLIAWLTESVSYMQCMRVSSAIVWARGSSWWRGI